MKDRYWNTQVLEAPRNTQQVRNAQKNLRRKNGQTDTLKMLEIHADDHLDCRYYNLTLNRSTNKNSSHLLVQAVDHEAWPGDGECSAWNDRSREESLQSVPAWGLQNPCWLWHAIPADRWLCKRNLTPIIWYPAAIPPPCHWKSPTPAHYPGAKTVSKTIRHLQTFISYRYKYGPQVSWVCVTDPRFTHVESGASIIIPVFQVR